MRNYLVLILLVVFMCSPVAFAGNDNGIENLTEGLVYGKGHAFWVSAPIGWILDNESGVKQGLHAVFYPKGSTWKDSSVVMYVNTVFRKPDDSLENFIKEDIETFKEKGSNNIKVITADNIKTNDGKDARVRVFTGDKWGNYEAVAFIPENKIFVMIVLTSRVESGFQKSLESFRSLVGSYKFWTEEVHIEKK